MKKLTEKLFQIFLGLTIFLIPWQTRWIYSDQLISGQIWEYGRLSLYLSLLCLSVAIVCRLIMEYKKSPTWSQVLYSWPLLIFLGYLLILSWLSIRPEVSLYYFNLIVFSFLFVYLLKSLEIKKIFWILTVSGLIQGLLAFYQFGVQQISANKWLGLAGHLPEIAGTSVVQIESLRWLRAYGSLPHPNLLGGFLVICILAAIWLWFSVYTEASQEHWSKIKTWQQAKKFVWQLTFLLVSLVIMTFGLLASFSRGAILALLIALIFILILVILKKDKLKIVVLIKYLFILLLTIAVFNILLPNSLWSRWQFDNRLEIKSVDERMSSWQQIDWHNPKQLLFGQGLGLNTLVNYHGGAPYSVQPIHNYWLLVLAEIGLIGLLLWLFIFWSFLRNKIFTLGHAWLLAWLVIGLFDHYWWTSWVGWLILAIIFANLSQQKKS